jgi:uncharacterized membrane protein YbaN (DUF454 family)
LGELATSPLSEPQTLNSRLGRTAYFAAGSFFVGLGVAGIILPLVPTTIFLLLAAGCYARSSTSAHRWLMGNRVFGNYLSNYQRRGATVRAKVTSITVLWAGIAATILLAPISPWVDALLVVIAAAVSWHLLRLETIRPQG